MTDEGFHEVQLDGKQLVALFIAAAVVLVATFVSGVAVGRGVRAQKESAVAGDVLTQDPQGAGDPTAGVAAFQPQAGATPQAPPASSPPSPPEEDLSYYSRLQGKGTPAESAQPAGTAMPGAAKAGADAKAKDVQAAAPALPKPAVKDDPAAALAPPKSVAPAGAATGEPSGPGWAVKIVAYRDRGKADALASRLSGKGYGAYVVPVSGKGSVLYSVQVGKFKTRREADAVRRRLEKEEQLKPSITR